MSSSLASSAADTRQDSVPADVPASVTPGIRQESSAVPAAQRAESTDFAARIEGTLRRGDYADRNGKLTSLLRKWVARDARAAAEYSRNRESPALREELLRGVLFAWAETDPAAALAWAALLQDAADREMAVSRVSSRISESDPQRAVHLVRDHGLDETVPGLMANLVGRWADEDLVAAYDWAGRQPFGEARDTWMARIAYVHSQEDPENAAWVAAAEVASPGVRAEAVISIVHQWALRDIDAAMDWVSHFPSGPLRDRAVTELEGVVQYDLFDSVQ